MTIARLQDEYLANKGDSKAVETDKGRFENHLLPDKSPVMTQRSYHVYTNLKQGGKISVA